jgi:hypothetical protein
MRGLRDAEKLALAIADNKIAANAGWDRRAMPYRVTSGHGCNIVAARRNIRQASKETTTSGTIGA